LIAVLLRGLRSGLPAARTRHAARRARHRPASEARAQRRR